MRQRRAQPVVAGAAATIRMMSHAHLEDQGRYPASHGRTRTRGYHARFPSQDDALVERSANSIRAH